MATLCDQCQLAVDTEGKFTPDLVHPESGKRMLFDVRGNAKCPTCGTIWHRDHKGLTTI